MSELNENMAETLQERGEEAGEEQKSPETLENSENEDITKRIATEAEERLQAHLSAENKRWQEQVESWRREAESDPVWGGENFAAGVARAQLALSRFDTDKTIGRFLEESGYGNHPAVVRFFNRVADAMAEDTPVSVYGSEGSLLPLEDRMYGNM